MPPRLPIKIPFSEEPHTAWWHTHRPDPDFLLVEETSPALATPFFSTSQAAGSFFLMFTTLRTRRTFTRNGTQMRRPCAGGPPCSAFL